ncbi:MAG: hypothetical protein AAGA90_23550 [Actinomycetota bacterium]
MTAPTRMSATHCHGLLAEWAHTENPSVGDIARLVDPCVADLTAGPTIGLRQANPADFYEQLIWRGTDRFVRVHVWAPNASDPDLHCHGFEVRSTVLAGGLGNRTGQLVPGRGSVWHANRGQLTHQANQCGIQLHGRHRTPVAAGQTYTVPPFTPTGEALFHRGVTGARWTVTVCTFIGPHAAASPAVWTHGRQPRPVRRRETLAEAWLTLRRYTQGERW